MYWYIVSCIELIQCIMYCTDTWYHDLNWYSVSCIVLIHVSCIVLIHCIMYVLIHCIMYCTRYIVLCIGLIQCIMYCTDTFIMYCTDTLYHVCTDTLYYVLYKKYCVMYWTDTMYHVLYWYMYQGLYWYMYQGLKWYAVLDWFIGLLNFTITWSIFCPLTVAVNRSDLSVCLTSQTGSVRVAGDRGVMSAWYLLISWTLPLFVILLPILPQCPFTGLILQCAGKGSNGR